MKHKHLTDVFSVSDQLTTGDVALAHAMGFKSVICNRPDGEEADQPLFEVIRTVAANSDLKTAYIPIKASGPTEEDFTRMTEIVGSLPKPLLAYCRTGGRSEALLKKIIELNEASDET